MEKQEEIKKEIAKIDGELNDLFNYEKHIPEIAELKNRIKKLEDEYHQKLDRTMGELLDKMEALTEQVVDDDKQNPDDTNRIRIYDIPFLEYKTTQELVDAILKSPIKFYKKHLHKRQTISEHIEDNLIDADEKCVKHLVKLFRENPIADVLWVDFVPLALIERLAKVIIEQKNDTRFINLTSLVIFCLPKNKEGVNGLNADEVLERVNRCVYGIAQKGGFLKEEVEQVLEIIHSNMLTYEGSYRGKEEIKYYWLRE